MHLSFRVPIICVCIGHAIAMRVMQPLAWKKSSQTPPFSAAPAISNSKGPSPYMLLRGVASACSTSNRLCRMQVSPPSSSDNETKPQADSADADAKLQLLVQQELDLAFQGVEDKIATADEAEAMTQIQQSADLVLQKVLTQMQADGEVLRGELDDRMANYTQMCRDSLLSKYDVSMADFQAEADGARTVIREEMARLTSLNQEYKEITASQAPSRNSVVGVIAFLVGLIYLGGAVNEWLKLALGAIDGDVTETVGSALVQSALAAVGIGTYFSRRGREGKEE